MNFKFQRRHRNILVILFISLVQVSLFQNCNSLETDQSNNTSTNDPSPVGDPPSQQTQCSAPWNSNLKYNVGQSITAYRDANLPHGSQCSSEVRTCLASGQWSGSYNYQACTVQPPVTQFSWVMGYDTSSASTMARPALNTPYLDSNYGTEVTRVTAANQVTDRDIPAWVRHEYSRRPAFNSNNTRALMITSNGWIRLYSVDSENNTMSFLKTLNIGGPVEPNWHPTNPQIVYYFSGKRIMSLNVETNTSSVAGDLTAQLPFGTSDAIIWTKEEGRPSDDGKIWCLIVTRYNQSTGSNEMFGMVSYNLETQQIIGSLANNTMPDHISTSPSGKYCVPSWAYNRNLGTRAYTLDFSKNVQLHDMSEHSDLVKLKNNNDAYVFFDYDSGDLAMAEFYTNASNNLVKERTNLFRIYGANNSATAGHVSGVNFKKPGYAVVSFYGCSQNYGQASCTDSQWFKNKIVIVALNKNFNPSTDIYNVAHNQFGNGGYFAETQAVTNNDLSKILFVSTWRSTAGNDVASYMVDVPVSSLP